MEHRAPRLPEITLRDITLDGLSIDKRDLFRFLHETKMLGEEAAERLLNEAIEIAALVDDLVRFHRRLESMSPGRFRILQDIDWVKGYMQAMCFGSHFPLTRRRIARRLARLADNVTKRQSPATLSESPPKNGESAPSRPGLAQQAMTLPLRLAQTPAKMNFSMDSLKALRARYAKFYQAK